MKVILRIHAIDLASSLPSNLTVTPPNGWLLTSPLISKRHARAICYDPDFPFSSWFYSMSFLATTTIWHNQRMLVADFAPLWFEPMMWHKKNSCLTISRNDIPNWDVAEENWARRYSFSICKWGESLKAHTLWSTLCIHVFTRIPKSWILRRHTEMICDDPEVLFSIGSLSIVLLQPSIQLGDAGGGFHLHVIRA